MKEFNVNILGTPYKCLVGNYKELKDLDTTLQGCCNYYSKEILVCTENLDGDANMQYLALRETILHELGHAFLYESGMLDYSSDEKIVDWISVNTFKLLDCLDKFLDTWDLTDEKESGTIK